MHIRKRAVVYQNTYIIILLFHIIFCLMEIELYSINAMGVSTSDNWT